MMENVDFQKHQEQLLGIITTPENVNYVRQWIQISGLDFNRVYTYEDFLEVVKLKGINVRCGGFRSQYVNPDPDLYPEL